MTLDSHLEYRAGELFCEGVSLSELAVQFGTPVYIYSQAAIEVNLHRLQSDLASLPFLPCYSVKANSNLSILRFLRESGCGFDIVSGGELIRVLRAGANPATVVYSGVGKTAGEMDAALRAGILMFNVESAGELDLLGNRARALGTRAPISVRINPGVEAETHPYISTGQAIHKFGVPAEEAVELYRKAAAAPEFKPCGVSCHIGSQIVDATPFMKAFNEIHDFAVALRADGLPLEYLDLGGGFGIRYSDERPLDFLELADGLATRLRGTPYKLIVEPGRSMVGNAGLLLSRVLYLKRNQQKNFIVVDAGMNDLVRPSLYGSFHEIVPARQKPAGSMLADVVGPICETGDFLARDREMPEVRPGELVAILTAGAYGFSLASNYNSRPRPPEVWVHGNTAKLVRRRETLEEMIRPEEA